MRSPILPAALAVVLLAVAQGAHAAGAWTTYLRGYEYQDLEVGAGAVWAVSLEGGLLRYDPAAGTFERLTREPTGLASNHLSALAFDRSGRLWVGTADAGVNRLSADGSRWDLVNEFDGLPAGRVRVIEAQGDSVWIGTENGIALWNGREIAGALPDGVNPSPFASNDIVGIAVLGDSLWVGTAAGVHVSRISTGLTSWGTVNQGLGVPALQSLASDGRTLMALVRDSVLRYEPATTSWTPTILNAAVRLTDEHGVILGARVNEIYRWTGTTWTSLGAGLPAGGGPRHAWAIGTDGAGAFFAMNELGLCASGATPWSFHEPESPPGNDIQNLLVDGPRLYVATLAEGMGRKGPGGWRRWASECLTGGAECDTVFKRPFVAFMLHEDTQGVKWAGFWARGIESFVDTLPEPQFSWHVIGDSLGFGPHTAAWAAASDDSGGRWFGMDTYSQGTDSLVSIGIEYYDRARNYRANYQPGNTAHMDASQVRALAVDRQRRLWVGYAAAGLDVFALPSAEGGPLVQFDEMSATAPHDIFGIELYGDSVWVLATDKLRLYDAPLRRLEAELTIAGAPAPRGAVHPLAVARDGSVWVGSEAGVRWYRRDGSQLDFNTSNSPIANDLVRAVRVDPASGLVWIGTGDGLSSFDPGWAAPPVPELPVLEARVYPNPATLTGLGVSLRLEGNAASVRGGVYDLSGRLLRRFEAQNGGVVWDGRDDDGQLVEPGLYFVRIEAGGRSRTARVTLLH